MQAQLLASPAVIVLPISCEGGLSQIPEWCSNFCPCPLVGPVLFIDGSEVISLERLQDRGRRDRRSLIHSFEISWGVQKLGFRLNGAQALSNASSLYQTASVFGGPKTLCGTVLKLLEAAQARGSPEALSSAAMEIMATWHALPVIDTVVLVVFSLWIICYNLHPCLEMIHYWLFRIVTGTFFGRGVFLV